MTTRRSVHALVDDLADDDLEQAMRALEEIKQGGFDLAPEDAEELARRRSESDAGQWVDARAFLAALREERSNPHR